MVVTSVVRVGVLVEAGVGAEAEDPVAALAVGERRKGHHPDRRGAQAQLGDQVGAVDPGHAQVEHDDVGLAVDGQGQGVAAVDRLPDQLEAPPLEGRPEQRSQLRDVVGEQDTDRCGWKHGGRHADASRRPHQ
jgi:hypothetical protein